MRISTHWILGAVALAIALPGIPAVAQDDDGAIDRIVVTARKKEESLQDAPLSITAFTGEQLVGLGIQETDDIMALAPNLYITQTPGSSANIGVSIRGVGGAEPLLTRDTGVAIYVDDAYVARTAGAVFDLVDLERVEILRGPQGTLYGRNATGGAVKYISRKPKEDFGFKQTFTFGKFSQFHSRTTVDTGLIGDTGLSAYGSFLHKERDGYYDDRNASDENDPGAYDTQAARIMINWDATEDINLTYAFDYSDLDGSPPYFQVFGVNAGVAGALATNGASLNLSEDRLENFALNFNGASIHEIKGHNLTLTVELGEFTLKSISTYREWENTEIGTDLDGTDGLDIPFGLSPAIFVGVVIPSPITGADLFRATNEREQDQFTQEIQLSGNITDDIDFVVGAYYFEEDFIEDNFQEFLVNLGPFNNFAVLHGPAGAPFAYEGENRSWAVYANGSWAFTERLAASVGVRYSRDDKEFKFLGSNTVNDDDWDAVDWSADLSFAATDNTNVYVRAATAFKSGGFNPRSGALANQAFDEETLTNYELGVKTLLWDGRVQLNAAVFYSDYEDLQTDQFAAGTGGATSITVNAGQATIQGIEIELLAQPVENLNLYLNYGYQDMEYDEYEVLHGGTNELLNIADDAIFAYRPENTIAAGIEYIVPLNDGMELSFRIDGRYVDELTWHATPDFITSPTTGANQALTPFSACGQLLDFAGQPAGRAACLEEDGYVTVDARITLSEIPLGERLRGKVAVFGRNILDEEYIVSGIDFGALGFGGARFGEPATFGVEFTFDY